MRIFVTQIWITRNDSNMNFDALFVAVVDLVQHVSYSQSLASADHTERFLELAPLILSNQSHEQR